ncbi:MAG: NAD(P)/FAD-dependent oxidoreductase [Ktedonobacteraceae bacterium]
MIVIIGAGLAGLTCARELVREGQRVLVLEASEQAGGRLRTDRHEDGYRLDRGFQVLFTAYPAAQRHLNYDNLKPRFFEPGALLVKAGKLYELADPWREPKHILPGMLNPLLSATDKLRVLQLRGKVTRLSTAEIFAGKGQPGGQDESTEAYLRRLGFKEDSFIANFARPFYGGIFLDRTLSTSARMFQFTFKMLATGKVMLPAEGIRAIPEMLASALPPGSLRYRARVSSILTEGGKVSGVRLSNGETIATQQVVVATDSPSAERLTGRSLPTEARGSVCVYFGGKERLYKQRKILLNTAPDAYVNNAVLLSNIAPTYAPPRRHLLSATIISPGTNDEELIAERALNEMAAWFPKHNLNAWQMLGVYRLPFSQLVQAPGFFDSVPANTTATQGLYLAGEYTTSSSIHGAMHSGEHAAKAVLKGLVAEEKAQQPQISL